MRNFLGCLSLTLLLGAAVHAGPITPAVWDTPSTDPGFNGGLPFLGDDSTIDVLFPFLFPFMGTNYTGGRISTNGFIYLNNDLNNFTGGADCCDGNPADFLSSDPRIAVGWTDWLVDDQVSGGGIYYNTYSDHVTVTYQSVFECCAFGPDVPLYTFQMQLYANGKITFGFADFNVPLSSHNVLIGISAGGGVTDPGSVTLVSDLGPRTVNFSKDNTIYELIYSLASDPCQADPQSCSDPQVAPLNVVFGQDAQSTVPEPSTYALMGTGVAGLLFFARKRKSAK